VHVHVRLLRALTREGMRCGGCVGHVKKVLEEQEGVLEVCVVWLHEIIDQHTAARVSLATISDDASLPCAMHVPGCVMGLQARVNLATETALVRVRLNSSLSHAQALQAVGEHLAKVCLIADGMQRLIQQRCLFCSFSPPAAQFGVVWRGGAIQKSPGVSVHAASVSNPSKTHTNTCCTGAERWWVSQQRAQLRAWGRRGQRWSEHT
jgi:copper chaperone CopZ